MKKNWKTSFSKCIYNFKDGLKIHDNYLYRWLTFSSPYIQTLLCKFKLHKPELQYMQPLSIAARYEKGNTCLLGLGGGGLVHYLNSLNIELTAVESNKLVIDLAQKYFFLDKLGHVGNLYPDSRPLYTSSIMECEKRINNLKIINIDASKFVENRQNKYSHLLIDIHGAYNFPSQCLNLDFFANCAKILKENGVLAINICNNHELNTIYNYLSVIFANKILSIPIKGFTNTILLASHSYSLNNILKIYGNHPEIKKLVWDEKFGYVAN